MSPGFPWATQPPYGELVELRLLIAEFKQALEAAKAVDRLTGQPDCEDPEKVKLVDRVAELERQVKKLSRKKKTTKARVR